MTVKKRVLFLAGGHYRRPFAGLRRNMGLLAAHGATGFSPQAVLAGYAISVKGESCTLNNADVRGLIETHMADPAAIAYFEHRMPFWSADTSWSPEEVVVFSAYTAPEAAVELEQRRDGVVRVEALEGGFALHQANP